MKEDVEIVKAYIQLNAIISVLPTEYENKIPKNIIDKIKSAKLKGYIFIYDYSKHLLEQNLTETAKEMLFDIFVKYLGNKEELKIISNNINKLENEM